MNEQKMKMLLSFLFIASVALNIFAQTLSIEDERIFNESAYRIILSYENSSFLKTKSDKQRFRRLFEKDDILIYNDLLGFVEIVSQKGNRIEIKPVDENVTVKDYLNFLSNQVHNCKFELKNIVKGQPFYKNGEWYITIECDKEISCSTDCGAILSSKEYYGTDHHLYITLHWIPDSDLALISDIRGVINSKKPKLGKSYGILEHTSKYDELVLCNSEPLRFNSYGQTFIPMNAVMTMKDADVKMKIRKDSCILKSKYPDLYRNEEGCRFMHISYGPRRFRARPFVDFSAGNSYNHVEATTGFNANRSSSFEMGVDFGYTVISKPQFKLSTFIGTGVEKSKIKMSLANQVYSTSVSGDADIDYDSYIRNYSISDLSNILKIIDLTIPVYADVEYQVVNRWSIFGDMGVRIYLNMKAEYSSISGTYTTSGLYPQYGNLIIDYTSNINGFVDSKKIDDVKVQKTQLNLSKLSLDAFAQLGVRYKVTSSLYIDIGAKYQQSILVPYEKESTLQLSKNVVDANNALMFYNNDNGEQIRGFAEGYNKLWRKSIRVYIGAMFKF